MKFYFDFEANKEKEIISVGVISENGDEFYSLVKPTYYVDEYIKNLTGITNAELVNADESSEVFCNLKDWIVGIEYNTDEWDCIVYGDSDSKFLEKTSEYCDYTVAKEFIEFLGNNVRNCHDMFTKFFCKSLPLISLYRLTSEIKNASQCHNAIDDAKMLKFVYSFVEEKLNSGIENIEYEINIPNGIVYSKAIGAKREKMFNSVREAAEWIVRNVAPDACLQNIEERIYMAYKNKKPYMKRYWRIESEVNE